MHFNYVYLQRSFKDNSFLMKLFTFIITLFSSFLIFGQTTVCTIVDKESQSGISSSSIYMLDLSLTLYANENGDVSIDSTITLPQEVEVKALGYKSEIITLTKNTTKVELEALHYHLEEVIVSVPNSQLQRQHIINVEARKMEQLSYIPSSDIVEQISNIPGVETTGNGAGISKPTIRGLSGSRIVTLLNGLRIENQQWGADHGTGITNIGIKGVEIIKGPASLLYGSDALGGIIYFTDQDYSIKPESYIKSSFESNNLGINSEVGTKFSLKNLRVNIFGSQSSQADYQIPSGEFVKNARFSNYNFKTAIGYQKKNYNLNLKYNYLSGRVGIPGHTHSANATLKDFLSTSQSRATTIPAQVINNHYLLLDNKFYFNKNTLSMKVGHVINHLQEYDEKVTFPAINLLLNTTNYNIQYSIPAEKSGIVIGVQGMLQDNSNERASEQIIPDATSFENGLFALYNRSIKKLEFQAGIRYDFKHLQLNNDFKGTENGTQKQFNSINYSTGFAYENKSNVYRLNLSSGYRAPNTSELYSNGVHHAALRYELGNTNLQSEQANQVDLSWELSKEHLSIIINPYFSLINNYIYISPLDSMIDNKNVYEYQQANKATLFGGELGVHYHPHFAHQIHFETNFSYTEGRLSEDAFLPLIPQPKLNSLIKYEGKREGKIALNNISLQHQYFLPQNNIGLNESASIDYHLVHIGVHLDLNFKWQSQLNFGVRNLFNEAYINHLSQLKYLGINNPGRNIYIGLKINIK